MGRPKRADEAGGIYHMLNRANRRETIFHKDVDGEAFVNVLLEALDRVGLRLYSSRQRRAPSTPAFSVRTLVFGKDR